MLLFEDITVTVEDGLAGCRLEMDIMVAVLVGVAVRVEVTLGITVAAGVSTPNAVVRGASGM